MTELLQILNSEDSEAKLALFQFSLANTDKEILLKFNLWARYFFPQYFGDEDAPFHEKINQGNLDIYRGSLESFVDIAFRGAGKDVKTKLFIAFCILNDKEHYRKFFKILTEDLANAKQAVTDIYNMMVNPRVMAFYPGTFEKTTYKREETMMAFTTSSGVKILADTVGTEQRGAIQEEARPDFIWFNDFESRKTLRSAVISRSIWDNMEEARTGLQKGGGCVYTCNYISEMGNVHRLVTEKLHEAKRVLIIPIMENGAPTWNRYSLEDIERMKQTDEDFEGERLCKPSATKDIYFDRESIDKMPSLTPLETRAGFKIYKKYDPSHRYAIGGDIAGGLGLDSSASVVIDFHTIPAQVVGTFHSNTIAPEAFGDELYNQGNYFGGCLIAPENNKYDQTILKVKQLGGKLYARKKGATTDVTGLAKSKYEYGWNTNSLTKPKMFSGLKKAIEDGLLLLNDEDLKREARSYNSNDLIDKEEDPRLSTRHFDLLTACAIAWQMKDDAQYGPVEVVDPILALFLAKKEQEGDIINPAE